MGGDVGAIDYKDLKVTASSVSFREGEALPRDATIEGHTWQYVNRDGGPDQRFRSNRSIPIALYGELGFTSSSGLNEVFLCSRNEVAPALATALRSI
jgi:hypothetical protein